MDFASLFIFNDDNYKKIELDIWVQFLQKISVSMNVIIIQFKVIVKIENKWFYIWKCTSKDRSILLRITSTIYRFANLCFQVHACTSVSCYDVAQLHSNFYKLTMSMNVMMRFFTKLLFRVACFHTSTRLGQRFQMEFGIPRNISNKFRFLLK